MVTFVSLEAARNLREEWRSAMTASGGPCVMTVGVSMMPWCHVVSSVFHL